MRVGENSHINTFYRIVTWCTLYLFFFQMLSQPVMATRNPAAPPPPAPAAVGTVIEAIRGVFIREAHAAADSVRATISPETSAATYQPVSAGSGTGAGGGEGGVNSAMGGFAYSYPLQVPPGRGGLTPQLAINYNSFASNGWLGTGWDLSIGSISRCTRNGPPAYNDYDSFVITLKGTAITLVREGGEYRLKEEGLFLRVVRSGNLWIATDKDGTRYYFGSNRQSRQNGPSGIFKWYLDRMEDANGNAVVFSYDIDSANNQFYLRQISYDVDNYILFESEAGARADAPSMFHTYFETRTVRRLKEIKVFNGGLAAANLVRRYVLAYDNNNATQQSFLKQITLIAGDGTAMPPVKLDYVTSASHMNRPFVESFADTWPSWGENFWTADFTGDGKTDVLVTPGQYHNGFGWRLYRYDNNRFVQIASGPEFDNRTIIHPGDFNGNGITDILAQPYGGGNVKIYLSNGAGFEPPFEGPRIAGNGFGKLYLLNLDGSGRSDLLITNCETCRLPARMVVIESILQPVETLEIYLNTGNGFQLITKKGGFSMQASPIIGDFTGDGKSNFIILGEGLPTELYFSTGDNVIAASEMTQNVVLPPDLSPNDLCYTGDFNGNGKTDILTIYNKPKVSSRVDYTGYRLYLSTGSGFTMVRQGQWPSWGERIMTGDFNGNGRTDILVTANRDQNNTWGGYRLFLSTGEGFVEATSGQWPSWGERLHLGDFNGNGRTDFIVSANRAYTAWQGYKLYLSQIDNSRPLPSTFPTLLGKITDSLGATMEIAYTPSSTWQNTKLPFIIQTVASVTQRDNMPGGHSTTHAYSYEGGLYDAEARQFRGFERASVRDRASGMVTDTYYHQDRRFQGRIESSTTHFGNPNHPVLTTANRWEAMTFNADYGEDPRVFTYVRNRLVARYDHSGAALATVDTWYRFDNYGNLLVEDTRVHNLLTDEQSRRFTRTQYQNDTYRWVLGKPTNIRIDAYDPGSPGAPALRETRFAYDPLRPWLLESQTLVNWDEDDQEIHQTTYFEYDRYGNTVLETDPRDPRWATVTDYSLSNGMFPNRITNALGHTAERVYDPRFGTVLKEIDPNGQRTEAVYDGFGRPVQVRYPNGAVKNYAYNIEPGNHFVRVSGSLLPTTTVFFDNMDRKIREEISDGRDVIVIRTHYDNQGRLWRQSLPHYLNTTAHYTRYQYDQRGRVTRQTNPDGTYRTVRYEHFEEIITDEMGNVKRMTKDALGRLVQVQEPTGGITQYAYDLFDNLIWVKDPLGAQTHIYYDSLGRKIFMEDPYMGHWEYHYDDAGNLIWQKDGEDQVVEMTYDPLNRLLDKNYRSSGKRIRHTYDEPRAGYFNIGRLTTITTTESGALFNTIAYDYDRMGKKSRAANTIDGVAYTTRYRYDQAGRIASIRYPAGSAQVDYSYYPMGHLHRVEKVEADGSHYPVAQYGGHNAQGQTGFVTFGNGVNTTYDYWPGNNRLRQLHTTAHRPDGHWGAIQSLDYQFDALGNITRISDMVNGVTHDFQYDVLSRLTRATAVCTADTERAYNQTYTYDLSGNMTAKTGLGGFQVLTWQDPETHIRPATVHYDDQEPGVGPKDIQYDQDHMPTHVTHNGVTTRLYYDGRGKRIKKVSEGRATIYVGGIYEKRGNQVLVHIFAEGRRIASIQAGQIFYTHGDHLGSASLVTDRQGRLVEELGYLPFGGTLFRNAFQGEVWTSVYRFTGQEYDAEMTLYNYNARLYDPIMGRFITPDTFVPDWTNPQSLNRYAYCLNNPLIYIDPSGHWGFLAPLAGLLKAIFWGAVIGAAVSGVMAAVKGGNIAQSMLQGAVTGAISGALFYGAGSLLNYSATAAGQASASLADQVAVHATAGAVSGATNAAITGGDMAQSALTGALSAGMAKGMGEYFGTGFSQRVVIGSAVGGVSSAVAGGDFVQGAFQGAWTTAIGDVCNRLRAKIIESMMPRLNETKVDRQIGRAVSQAGKDLYGIAKDEGPLAQTALGVACATTVGPLAGAGIMASGPGGALLVYYVAPHMPEFIYGFHTWTGAPQGLSGYVGGFVRLFYDTSKTYFFSNE